MTGPVKGWCPGALRPMESGDGWIIRLRPFAGRLSAAQLTGLAALAQSHGIAAFSLSNRANLQLRGLTARQIAPLQQGLRDLGLIDPSPEIEARRNILMTPCHMPADQSLPLYRALDAALGALPVLPAKFGFAVDTGSFACLQQAPADLRFEISAEGLILRAEGMELGEIQPDIPTAIARVIEICQWFAARAASARRMGALVRTGTLRPLRAEIAPRESRLPDGLLYAPFGEVGPNQLAALGTGIRLTPWRAILPEAPAKDIAGWITEPDDPLMRIDACPGAPHCRNATVQTRALGPQLAPLIAAGERLHISGCAKGCAAPWPSTVTLCGNCGRFDLVRNGKADEPPTKTGLSPDALFQHLRGFNAT